MKELTLVCCFNDIDQYHVLQNSLLSQDIEYELIGLDNTGNRYKSCSNAFNSVLSKIETRFVIFTHQDIEFLNEHCLRDFLDCLKKIDEYDILGVAGPLKNGGCIATNVIHGEERTYAGRERVYAMTECDTIDECFFGGHLKYFLEYPFDEVICDNWHLYAVDRCLNSVCLGNHVYLCPVSLYHKSKGKINNIYIRQFYKLSKKYSRKIRVINTTCARAYAFFPLREMAYIKRTVSLLCRRK